MGATHPLWQGRRPPVCGTRPRRGRWPRHEAKKGHNMKGVLAWLIGIPIPIIIVLYLLDVF